MFKQLTISRIVLLYGIAAPLALFLGYIVATASTKSTGFFNYALVCLVLLAIAFPLILRWHHAMVIIGWNAAVIVFFLPGMPQLGIVLACLSLFISIIDRTLDKEKKFIRVPQVTIPVVALFVVVLITAYLTGGIGGRALGNEMWGGKRYLGIFGAVIAYFAITARPIPAPQAQLYSSLYFLLGVSTIGSNLVYLAGPAFYFLYQFFPVETAYLQALEKSGMIRINGLAFASLAAIFFMILRYGIRGLMDFSRPWRMISLLLLIGLGMLGGYRSTVILLALVLVAQFFYEKLFRTHYLVIFALIGILSGVLMVGFIDKMPLAVQRSVSFLPLDIDPVAERDAQGTLDWRLEMWRVVIPEVPKYLLLGKGYAYSGVDYFLTEEAVRRGIYRVWEATLINGNYHNGILTLLVPFGIWGMAAFIWLCAACYWVLYKNYLYGDPSLNNINTFLIAFFAGRVIFYFVFYGQFDIDLQEFVVVTALSIALNRGVKSPSRPSENGEQEPVTNAALGSRES